MRNSIPDYAMSDQTLDRIRKIRVDALYGKKKHFNAADRKRTYQARVSVTVILLNVVLGSALFLYAKEAVPQEMKWAGGCLALCAAALTAMSSYFSWPKMVQGHGKVGNQYLNIVKQCSNILARYADGNITEIKLGEQLEWLTNEMTNINDAASAYPTSGADYRAAQQGIYGNEEDYTVQELGTGD